MNITQTITTKTLISKILKVNNSDYLSLCFLCVSSFFQHFQPNLGNMISRLFTISPLVNRAFPLSYTHSEFRSNFHSVQFDGSFNTGFLLVSLFLSYFFSHLFFLAFPSFCSFLPNILFCISLHIRIFISAK